MKVLVIFIFFVNYSYYLYYTFLVDKIHPSNNNQENITRGQINTALVTIVSVSCKCSVSQLRQDRKPPFGSRDFNFGNFVSTLLCYYGLARLLNFVSTLFYFLMIMIAKVIQNDSVVVMVTFLIVFMAKIRLIFMQDGRSICQF